MSEEIKNKAVELSDEETAKAAGGTGPDDILMNGTHVCKHCHKSYKYTTTKRDYIPKCPYCYFNPMTGKIEPPIHS